MKKTKKAKYPKIAKAFKSLRDELTNEWGDECTQDELASKIDIVKSRISVLENGKDEPSVRELKAYSKLFNAPMEYLLGLSENRHYENIDVGTQLGLSDTAIKSLKAWKEDKLGLGYNFLINSLISYGCECGVLSLLNSFLFSSPKGFQTVTKADDKQVYSKVMENILILSDNDYAKALNIKQFENFTLFEIQNNLVQMKQIIKELDIVEKSIMRITDFGTKEIPYENKLEACKKVKRGK